MPSRRRLLAGCGIAVAGFAAGGAALTGDSSIASAAGSPPPEDGVGSFDWPMARYDAAGTGHNPDASGPKDDVSVAWERSIDERAYGDAAPILVGDTVFVVGRRSIVALDRETGDVRFARSGSYRSSPTRADASAYRTATLAVAGSDGIYGLNAGGGYEFLGRSFGTERWHGPGRSPSSGRRGGDAPPAPVADGETVYAIVPATDRVAAFDANSGRVRWERTIGEPRSIGSHRPAVRDGTVYVSSRAGDVAAFDAETGESHWSVSPDSHADSSLNYRNFHPPTATDAGLVVPDREGVTLLDPTDGGILWEYEHGGNATEGSVAVADGVAFVTDGDGSLHAIDVETGADVWSIEYGRQVEPVVADGVVYLGYGWLNELVAIDADTGERRWTYETETIGFSQPIVGDGTLYAAVADGVVALEEAE